MASQGLPDLELTVSRQEVKIMTDADKHCLLCGCKLTAGDYGPRNPTHHSSHHRIPKCLRGWVAALAQLEDQELLLCYCCHEQLIEKPILLPGVEPDLELTTKQAGRDAMREILASETRR